MPRPTRDVVGRSYLDLVGALFWIVAAALAIAGVGVQINAMTLHPVWTDLPLTSLPPPAVVQQVSALPEPCHVAEIPVGVDPEHLAPPPTATAHCLVLDNAWLRTWTRLGLAAWLLVLAAALVLIGRLIERIRSGRAFTDTSRTLRRLALVIGLGVPVAIGLDTYGGGLIAGRAGLGPYYGHHLTWVSIGAWFGAVMITLALAEAFRHGERMRHDLDGLV